MPKILIILILLSSSAYSQVIGTSTSSNSLGSSVQTKSFVNDTTKTLYQFYNDGTQIVAKGSVPEDITSWSTVGSLPYDTSDFSIAYEAGTLLVVLSFNNDVLLVKGIETSGSISFGSPQVILDGTGDFDSYKQPSIIIEQNGTVVIGAIHKFTDQFFDNERVEIIRSTGLYTSNPISFNPPDLVGLPEESITTFAVVSEGSAFIHTNENQIFHYKYSGGNWTEANQGALDTFSSFDVELINKSPQEMAVYNGMLFIGGDFVNRGGDSPSFSRLVAFDGTDFIFPGPVNGDVVGFAHFQGSLFIAAGRDVHEYDGTNMTLLISTSSLLNALGVYNNELYIGGNFLDADGIPDADRIVRYDGTNFSAVGSGLSATPGQFEVYNGELYITGAFTNAGGDPAADNFAKFDGTNFSSVPGVGALNASTMKVYGGFLYLAGSFIDAGGDPDADRLARYNGTTISSVNGIPLSNFANALYEYNGELHIGGAFVDVDGDPDADYWVKTDGTTISPVTSETVNRPVTFAEFNGSLFVGGIFDDTNSTLSHKYLTSFDGTSFTDPQLTRRGLINGSVRSMAIYDGDLYLGGNFENAAGLSDGDYIVAYDGSSFSTVGGGLNSQVVSLHSYSGDLYIGGDFTDAGGDPAADYLAVYDGSTFSSVVSGLDNTVFAFEEYGGNLYFGGSFQNAGGDPLADRIAVFDGTSVSSLGTSLSGPVTSLQEFSGQLYMGGSFTDVGGDPSIDGLTRYDGTNFSSAVSNLSVLGFFEGTVTDLEVYNGLLYVSGAFTDVDGDPDRDWLFSYDGTSSFTLPGDGLPSDLRMGRYNGLLVFTSFLGSGPVNAGPEINTTFAFDGSNYLQLGSGERFTGWSIIEYQNKLYIGGSPLGGGASSLKYPGLAVLAPTTALGTVPSFTSNKSIYLSLDGDLVDRTYTSTWSTESVISNDTILDQASSGTYTVWIDSGNSLRSSSQILVSSSVGTGLGLTSNSDSAFYTYTTGNGPYDINVGFVGAGLDTDFDDDGLSNDDEALQGTDPNDSDSDDDGINDGDEVNIHSSDPLNADSDSDGIQDDSEVTLGLNPNSYEYPLNSPALLGWNSFLGLTNILELSNRSNSFQAVSISVLAADGSEVTAFSTGLLSGEKKDIILNDFLPANAYGNLKLDFNSHALRARTALYHEKAVYHQEARDPITGSSYVHYNSYNPSTSNFLVVENWLSITNTGSSEEFFTVTKYNELGEPVEVQGFFIGPEGRVDIDGGVNDGTAGYISIESSAQYLAFLNRQGYSANGTFEYATAIGAVPATTSAYVTTLGTSYLELANTCSSSERFTLTIEGAGSSEYQIEPNHHLHIFTQATGLAHAIASNPCVLLTAFRYQGDITGLSSTGNQQPRTGTLSSRYNTFMGQTVTLLLSNTTNASQSISITTRNALGSESIESISLPANSSTTFQIPAPDDSYGTVDIIGSGLVASLLSDSSDFSDSVEAR